jgi:hypothetical protein
VGVQFFAHVQTGPGAHPACCTMGTGSFPGVKRPERGAYHPPSSSERVELYLYPPSRPVQACNGRALLCTVYHELHPCRKIFHVVDQNVHYRSLKRPPLVPILTQVVSFPAFPLLKIRFNIFFAPTPGSPKSYLCDCFSQQSLFLMIATYPKFTSVTCLTSFRISLDFFLQVRNIQNLVL